MFIKLDRYSEEMFKVRLCAENARARIESLRLARATRTRAIFARTRNIFLASRARNARVHVIAPLKIYIFFVNFFFTFKSDDDCIIFISL